MTLLTISNAVADEANIDRPATVVGNTSPDAQKMLRLCNKVGKNLMKAFPWQILRGEQTFTSVANETQTSILPDDFDRIVSETFWNRSQKVLISGPVSPVQWQGLKAQDYNRTNYPRFAHRGGNILVLPTLGAGDILAFEYVKNTWARSSGGADQTAFAADTDTSVIDEELITRGVIFEWLASEGQPTAAKAAADFQSYFDQIAENEQADPGIMVSADIFGGGRHFAGAPPVSTDISIP